MPFSHHHANTEVRRSPTQGMGLFATGPLFAGDLVVTTGGRILPFESLLSHELPGHPIQVETHWVLAPFDPRQLDGIFVVNHSCDPNLGVRGQLSLVALRAIAAGEELTFDYSMTDSDPEGQETFAMDCLCGATHCRKRITDRDWRDPALQKKYRGHFSTYLQLRIEAGSR
jgi:uncharacterized protein